jgi:hypothetical protein
MEVLSRPIRVAEVAEPPLLGSVGAELLQVTEEMAIRVLSQVHRKHTVEGAEARITIVLGGRTVQVEQVAAPQASKVPMETQGRQIQEEEEEEA